MSMCEKCWSAAYRDSYCNPSKTQSECFEERIKNCNHTPQQQAGNETEAQ
jgi:hypothetical protein